LGNGVVEWRLGWHLLQHAPSTTETVCARSQPYLPLQPALHNQDFQQAGWIDCSDNRHSVAFIRRAQEPEDFIITVQFTSATFALPYWRAGRDFMKLFNSDAREYGGSNMEILVANGQMNGHTKIAYSIDLCLPPLGLILKLNRQETAVSQ